MCLPVPLPGFITAKPDPRRRHQRSGLQGLTRMFPREKLLRPPTQFRINQLMQFIGGFGGTAIVVG